MEGDRLDIELSSLADRGLPCTWEGWLVMLAYLTLLPLAVNLCPPDRNMPGFIASVSGLTAMLVAICWWKGEPPKWRWG